MLPKLALVAVILPFTSNPTLRSITVSENTAISALPFTPIVTFPFVETMLTLLVPLLIDAPPPTVDQ